jgi:hypothetical protein
LIYKSFSSGRNETLSLIAPAVSFFPDYVIPLAPFRKGGIPGFPLKAGMIGF